MINILFSNPASHVGGAEKILLDHATHLPAGRFIRVLLSSPPDPCRSGWKKKGGQIFQLDRVADGHETLYQNL